MSYVFNTFAIPYLMALFVAGFIPVYAFVMFEKTRTSALFIALTSSFFFWVFGTFFEMISTTEDLLIFWEYIRYIGLIFGVVFFLLFTLSLTSFAPKLFSKPQFLIFFFVPGTIDLLLIFTNNFHESFYTDLSLHPSAPLPALHRSYGVLYNLHILITASFIIGGVITLILGYRRALHKPYRRQIQFILLGILFFILIISISTLNIFPTSEYLDVSPLAYAITSFFIFIAMREYHLVDIIPLAHQIIFAKLTKTGVIATDKTNRVIEINNNAREYLFQAENLEIIGMNLFHLIYAQKDLSTTVLEKFRKIEAFLIESQEDKHAYSTTFEFEKIDPLKPDIEYFNVSVEALRGTRSPTGFMYIIGNVTAEKKMEIATQKSSDFKDSLLGVISHDLRSQLFIIHGFTEVLRKELSKDEHNLFEYLDGIDAKVDVASTVISDVRSYLKVMGTFDKPLEPSIVDLKDILNSTTMDYKSSLMSKQLTLSLKEPEDTKKILILADLRVKSVFNNLLDNAIKWSPEKGTIEITINKEDQFWLFTISDEGPGIEDALKKTVFKPFTSYGPAEKVGSGLGLSITTEIITAFKGKIWLETNTPTGLKVKFTLPIVINNQS